MMPLDGEPDNEHEGAGQALHIKGKGKSQSSFHRCTGLLSHASPILCHLQSLVKSKTAPGERGEQASSSASGV